MKYIVSFILLTTASLACAQKFTLTGQLVDTLRTPLPGATVMILNEADSSLVNFALSEADGYFAMKNLQLKDYILKITFMGFRTHEQRISGAKEKTVVDLGQIQLQPILNELQAVEIEADRPPVVVKKDTIEFNATSFKTQENAVVEDLLKKLPGVEVDSEGKVTAQGEEVKSIMVDGKKFFGNDPKIATRNLPANAVDKVQVFDKQSDQSTFTGIDDGQREKTINLSLKEEKRNAIFGSAMAGAGTDERLQARASLNKFSKGQQLSFLGTGNNINQSGFGMEDYLNFTGGSRQMMGGGPVRFRVTSDNANGVPLNFENRANGLMNTYAGGLNINDEITKNTEVNGSYFYNYLNHMLDQSTYRENFLRDGTYTFLEDKTENNTNSNHRANFTLDQKIDSANTLRFTGSFALNQTDSEQLSRGQNTGPEGDLVSENERRYLSNGDKASFNGNLLFRHRFSTKGRSLAFSLLFGANQNKTAGLLNALNTFHGDSPGQDIVQQTNDQSTRFQRYGATVSYTEPLGNQRYLEANYSYNKNRNDVGRDVFDIANGESTFNETLSQEYDNDYEYHRAGLNFRIAHNDYNFVAGANLQQSALSGEREGMADQTSRTFTNLLPAVRFHYNFSNTRHLRFDYETSVSEPDIQQLQPVVDNSDPLNIYIGNPDLRPSYSQSWRLNYAAFNPVSFINFFVFTDIDLTSNAITNGQSVDERLVRTIMPVNVDRNLRINTNANFAVPVKGLGSRINLSASFRRENATTILNDEENGIAQTSAGGTLRYTYEYKEVFDIALSATLRHQQTRYDFDQPGQTFLNSVYAAEGNLHFLKNYSLNANFDYLLYQDRSAGFEQDIPLLNLSVSRFFLKNKSGELKVAVMNVFDQALGVDQTASSNYLERVTTNSLGRYLMVSFTYALNKALNPMNMRRRGGPMMRFGG
ncbi:MAG TPA: outer membrane beta-barrel protein [Chryseosolibacter sp.]|nr:outer membrane beta-barrel protein [Chryseosolibacter sp.]